jgi:hypothetical protein
MAVVLEQEEEALEGVDGAWCASKKKKSERSDNRLCSMSKSNAYQAEQKCDKPKKLI